MRGPNYHWVIDLYERLNLPVVPAVVQALHKATSERIANLEKQKNRRRKAKKDSHEGCKVRRPGSKKEMGKAAGSDAHLWP